LGMVSDVAGAETLQGIVIDTVAVEVASEQTIAIALGPIIAQVDHGPNMGMSAARYVMVPLTATRLGPVAARPVDVVGTTLQQSVTVRVDVLPIHPLEVRTGD